MSPPGGDQLTSGERRAENDRMGNEARIDEILDFRKLDLPVSPRVVDLRYEPYVDSLGDDALWIYVILADDTPEEQRRWAKLAPIEEAIHEALLNENVRLWPYMRFRTWTELEDELRDS